MPASLSRPARSVVVDLAEDASVAAATARVGAVDGVVFLAGVLWPTRAHDRDAAKVTAICTVTFTGCARVLGAVVPEMVARGSGHGVIAGSLSGFRGLTGAIGYAASKAGSMAEAESMYCDLRGSGGKVQRANPGFIRTRLTDKNDFLLPFFDGTARGRWSHAAADARLRVQIQLCDGVFVAVQAVAIPARRGPITGTSRRRVRWGGLKVELRCVGCRRNVGGQGVTGILNTWVNCGAPA